jgi:hypothetical protein
MRTARWLVLVCVVLFAAPLLAGDIQVLCEPGLRVYLDGDFVGVSTAKEDGRYLTGVTEGQHRLWVEKDGFLSQSFAVEIHKVPIEVKVGEFAPVPQAPPDQEPAPAEVIEAVGSLMILSAPQNCVVEVDGTPHTKDAPQLSLAGLTAGNHTVSFTKPGYAPISAVVKVEPGGEITVRGDLQGGTVEVVHEGKGSLRVYSKPTYCTLHFMGRLIEKTNQVMNMSFVPAGEYQLVASWGGREVATTITVRDNQRTIVTISFADEQHPFAVAYEPQ